MERPDGYYWIRWFPDGRKGEPVIEIARWTNPNSEHPYPEGWTVCGSEVPLDKSCSVEFLYEVENTFKARPR